MKPIPFYVLDNAHHMKSEFLDDETYGKALASFVLVTTDCLIIDHSKKTVYLARRKAKPMSDQWWFIGGRTKAGEHPEKAMERCFRRETGLALASERFEYVTINEYLFPDRQQLPQETGTHTISRLYCVELSTDEIASVSNSLDTDEYHSGGLKEFTLESLKSEGVHESIIAAARMIFSHE
jgi:ADP-ribose pyrophosphatase YjhB (NUDIX family)